MSAGFQIGAALCEGLCLQKAGPLPLPQSCLEIQRVDRNGWREFCSWRGQLARGQGVSYGQEMARCHTNHKRGACRLKERWVLLAKASPPPSPL